MKKTNNNLIILNAVFVMSLLVANIVGGKVVSIIGLTVPAAVVSYAITFLCTDIINELWEFLTTLSFLNKFSKNRYKT